MSAGSGKRLGSCSANTTAGASDERQTAGKGQIGHLSILEYLKGR
jgi:hypothetical protein